MTIEYHLIQYVDDPLRGEGRNIGVVARWDYEAGFRFIGLDGMGRVDIGCFSSLFGREKGDAWVFAEWIDWFRSLSSKEIWYPEAFDEAIAELESSGGRIVARKGGVLEGAGEGYLDVALDYLFERLVGNPARPRKRKFDERLEQILQESEICFRPDFVRNVEVEFQPGEGKPPETVRLFCLLENKPRTVFKTVRFRTGGESLIRQVNDAIYTFGMVVEHGFADKDRCVILTEAIPSGSASNARRLADAGHLIDVHQVDAAAIIRNIVRIG